MKTKQATLYFNEGKLKFSAGHFTIFSKTQRETLHGHNYTLEIMVKTQMQEPGITFDYRLFEEKIIHLCQQLNWHFLVPSRSPYLIIQDDGEHYEIIFNHESMWLLKKDVVLLELDNITLETLSEWFAQQVQNDADFMQKFYIQQLQVKVFNGPAHAAEVSCTC